VWFTLWILLNSGHLIAKPLDPFPLTLLTTIVSLEAIFLTLFVLASEYRLTQDAVGGATWICRSTSSRSRK